ncbi:hypothetical protein JHK84_040788 [Glycine max]|nr:hypothetical protein JHK86_040575 [Glycine max]KAG5122448.1 hypothetical protein JHK84_040788 [Glycine max]
MPDRNRTTASECLSDCLIDQILLNFFLGNNTPWRKDGTCVIIYTKFEHKI